MNIVEKQYIGEKFNISKNRFIYCIVFLFLSFPHTKPAYFETVILLDQFFNIWRLLSFGILFIWYFLIRKKICKIVILIGVINIYLILITFMQNGELFRCVNSAFSMISVAMLLDIGCEKRELFYSPILLCFEISIYINLISELTYPKGMYTISWVLGSNSKNYFLGYYNNHTKYFIPAILFALMYMYYTGKKIRTVLLMSIIVISAIRVWSGGVIMALLAMTVIYLFGKKLRHILNYYSFWLLHVLFIFGIMFLKIQNLFQWLIDDMIGKWGSLIGRIKLWNSYIMLIKEAPIIGYGEQSSFMHASKSGFRWGVHAHNMLLEILYQGGFIYLILFIILIYTTGKAMYRSHDMEKLRIIEAAFCGWCIQSLVEPFFSPFLMGMFVIAYKEGKAGEVIKTYRRVRFIKKSN